MAKDKISDYSSTANSNTDIAGINIDEGCAPSGINDAIRTLMAQLKTWQSGGQDVYIHPAGSASAPSITANGDTNTGIFFPAADTIAFAEGGVEAMRLDSAGNMGLGVTPSSWSGVGNVLELSFAGNGIAGGAANSIYYSQNAYFNGTNWIYGSTNAATYYRQGQGLHRWYNAASGTAGNAITFTQAMTLDASGNLGVGTTSPLQRLDVASSNTGVYQTIRSTSSGATNVALRIQDGTTGTGNGDGIYLGRTGAENYLWTYENEPWAFGTNNTERARILSTGTFLVGKSTAGDTVIGSQIGETGYITATRSQSTNSDTTYHVYSTGAGAYRFYVGMGGTVYATSTTISSLSDIRHKENIRDLDVGLAEVMSLKPRLYDWKEGKGADIKNARGFIAQEFEEVFPDLIDEWRDPAPEGEEPYKSVRADLIPVLVKAIQEQQAIITALTARITALEQA